MTRNLENYRAANRRSYIKHKEKIKRNRRNKNQELRNTILKAYGNKCACCGESESIFLQIDHVNGKGCQHRRQVGSTGAMYSKIIEENFPSMFQLLCANCHVAKTRNEVCPHKREH